MTNLKRDFAVVIFWASPEVSNLNACQNLGKPSKFYVAYSGMLKLYKSEPCSASVFNETAMNIAPVPLPTHMRLES
jgi:hypothetical protein